MKNRRLYFISTRDVRKNRADCVHFMRVCHEFVKNEFDVTMITPRKYRIEYKKKKNEIWSLYSIPESFKIVELPTLLWDNMPDLLKFWTISQKFIFFLLFYFFLILSKNANNSSIIYSVCYVSLLPALFLRRIGLLKSKIFFEKADIKTKWIHRFTAKNIDGFIALNSFLKNKIISSYGFPEDRVFKRSFPSMVSDFSILESLSTEEARQRLNIEKRQKIVMYAGKISPQLRENHYILESAKFLTNIQFYFVGVREINKSFFNSYLIKNNLDNVKFVDFQPLNEFMLYIKSADILVSYYDSFDYYSVTQRVPAKSSLYLAANKPIIFADLPSLREWFSDSMVYFVPSDKPHLLAKKIDYIFNNPGEAREKAQRCVEFAKENTYERAYEEVSKFLKKINEGQSPLN